MEHYRKVLTRQLCTMKVVETKVKPRISIGEDDIRAAYTKLTSGVIR